MGRGLIFTTVIVFILSIDGIGQNQIIFETRLTPNIKYKAQITESNSRQISSENEEFKAVLAERGIPLNYHERKDLELETETSAIQIGNRHEKLLPVLVSINNGVKKSGESDTEMTTDICAENLKGTLWLDQDSLNKRKAEYIEVCGTTISGMFDAYISFFDHYSRVDLQKKSLKEGEYFDYKFVEQIPSKMDRIGRVDLNFRFSFHALRDNVAFFKIKLIEANAHDGDPFKKSAFQGEGDLELDTRNNCILKLNYAAEIDLFAEGRQVDEAGYKIKVLLNKKILGKVIGK